MAPSRAAAVRRVLLAVLLALLQITAAGAAPAADRAGAAAPPPYSAPEAAGCAEGERAKETPPSQRARVRPARETHGAPAHTAARSGGPAAEAERAARAFAGAALVRDGRERPARDTTPAALQVFRC